MHVWFGWIYRVFIIIVWADILWVSTVRGCIHKHFWLSTHTHTNQIYILWYFLEQPVWNFMNKYIYFVQVDGMDVLAVKQACKFAKEHALKNGPLVSTFTCCYVYEYLFQNLLILLFSNGCYGLIVHCSSSNAWQSSLD
jgi:hypothetical protein